MNETRPNHRLIETEDQSPSLETTYQSGVIEKMHHFRGAFSETVYVYGPAIEWALNQVEQPRVMSLGLGLGYNEFLALGMAMAAQKSLSLTTFELDRQLVTQLISWTNNSQPEWAGAYDSIIERVATEVRVSHEALKDFVVESLKNGLWQIRGAFPQELPNEMKFHCILYDAFSRKMDFDLWNQDFLTSFLANHANEVCCLATYAATGNLKRALKQNKFTVTKKIGFAGKKESTFSYRSDLSPIAIASTT